MTAMQLSMTCALMLKMVSFDFLTSLKKVKSKTTVPSIGLLWEVPANDADMAGDVLASPADCGLTGRIRYPSISQSHCSPGDLETDRETSECG